MPLLNVKIFTFTYEIKGLDSQVVNQIFIKIVSGYSSFVDFLVFYQDEEPNIEVIQAKNLMRRPPRGNIPINIYKNKIQVSGRLFKSGGLGHDPNIGSLSLICATLRFLGWRGDLEITLHGLSQSHVNVSNKFIKIANRFNIGLKGLNIAKAKEKEDYWKYDLQGEKLGTIFI